MQSVKHTRWEHGWSRGGLPLGRLPHDIGHPDCSAVPAAETGLARYQEQLAVALLFIGQQLVMFGRYWFRVAGWASAWSSYSGSRQISSQM